MRRACAYVRSTFHYRTISELQNSSRTLRLYCFYWCLLTSFVLSLVALRSARTLGNSTPSILNFVTHLSCFSHIPRQGIVNVAFEATPAYAIALRLVGYDKLPISLFRRLLYVLANHQDLLSLTSPLNVLHNFFQSYGWHSGFLLRALRYKCSLYFLL